MRPMSHARMSDLGLVLVPGSRKDSERMIRIDVLDLFEAMTRPPVSLE